MAGTLRRLGHAWLSMTTMLVNTKPARTPANWESTGASVIGFQPGSGQRSFTTASVNERATPDGKLRILVWIYDRGRVGDTLGLEHPALDDVTLLVSELVTNAIARSDSNREGGTVSV